MTYLEPVQTSGKTWVRCYQATEHNCSAIKFHELCDNKGPTVILVRSKEYVFGGYTDKNWTSPGENLVPKLLGLCYAFGF